MSRSSLSRQAPRAQALRILGDALSRSAPVPNPSRIMRCRRKFLRVSRMAFAIKRTLRGSATTNRRRRPALIHCHVRPIGALRRRPAAILLTAWTSALNAHMVNRLFVMRRRNRTAIGSHWANVLQKSLIRTTPKLSAPPACSIVS